MRRPAHECVRAQRQRDAAYHFDISRIAGFTFAPAYCLFIPNHKQGASFSKLDGGGQQRAQYIGMRLLAFYIFDRTLDGGNLT